MTRSSILLRCSLLAFALAASGCAHAHLSEDHGKSYKAAFSKQAEGDEAVTEMGMDGQDAIQSMRAHYSQGGNGQSGPNSGSSMGSTSFSAGAGLYGGAGGFSDLGSSGGSGSGGSGRSGGGNILLQGK